MLLPEDDDVLTEEELGSYESGYLAGYEAGYAQGHYDAVKELIEVAPAP